MENISSDYLGNRTDLENGILTDFNRFEDIRITYSVSSFLQINDEVHMNIYWLKTQKPITDGSIQKSSGTTELTFIRHSPLRLAHLRGDLIFATISPDVAADSGKSSTVVSDIRTIYNEGGTGQAGSGGTVSGGSIDLKTTSLDLVCGGSSGTSFAAGSTCTPQAVIKNVGSGDLTTSADIIFNFNGPQVGATVTLSSLAAGASTTVTGTASSVVIPSAGSFTLTDEIERIGASFDDADTSNDNLTTTITGV